MFGMRGSKANVRLICGSIWGYGWDEIRVWAHSLYRANIDARKIVFCRGISPLVKDKLHEIGIETIDWSSPNTRLHPITTRWEPILSHLSQNQYSHVVCTDIKDCIYQADPFPYLQDRPIVLATESIVSGDPIHNQENYRWMVEYLGKDAGPMKNKEVVCGGTIAGPGVEIYRMIGDMYQILATHPNPRLIDQCVLNHLAHTSYRGDVMIPRLSEGFVLSGNFCWKSRFDPPPVFRDGLAYPSQSIKPFCIYHLYYPHHKKAIQSIYWSKNPGQPECLRCGASSWGKQGMYGPVCNNCKSRYGYPPQPHTLSLNTP